MDHPTLLIIIATALGFFMAWGIGANDVANAMGTSVGSKALNLKQAILVAGIFEFCGAFLAGGQVTETIRSKIIDTQLLHTNPEILIYGMLAALLAAGIWLLIASSLGWPVSTTHSIVGAIVGFGLIELGPSAIHWHEIYSIALSWIVTPIIAGILAYLTFMSVQKLILAADDPFASAKRFIPLYMFITCFIVSLVTTTKGIKHLGIHYSMMQNISLSATVSLSLSSVGAYALYRIPSQSPINHYKRTNYRQVEQCFAVLMVFTACAMAFAHGSNDVANAIGPLAAVVNIAKTGYLNAHSPIESWTLIIGALGILLGLSTYGYRVIRTVGRKITHLTPSRGFSAELATATTVVIASGTGLPVSTTQTLVGAILGVGIARGIGALRLHVIRSIFLSWIITLPMGATLAIVFFEIFKWLL